MTQARVVAMATNSLFRYVLAVPIDAIHIHQISTCLLKGLLSTLEHHILPAAFWEMQTRSGRVFVKADTVKDMLLLPILDHELSFGILTGPKPTARAKEQVVMTDDTLTYTSFHTDFGPIDLGKVYHFCVQFEHIRKVYLLLPILMGND